MNMKKKMMVHRLLAGTLALLGFASCSDGNEEGELICEYGTPYSKFLVKGKVNSDKDEPLKGIQVIVRSQWNNNAALADTVYTDEKGEFRTEELRATGIEHQQVYFNDIDGEENGGAFKSDSVLIKYMNRERLEEGSGWYVGKFEYSTKKPVKLSEKQENMVNE
ncbi:radical SAM-associated putative lipoprotein [uncultured Phocaeicola sp.]|uniref:radical SAM-associated putative lipoprotein n=1 Tax=uncultured Phocaeicola sp. TaxID=990718 RepID=UPI00143354CF|nr:radical SAM-associated putative lipoprotein [uncultured Phocaeicola sp.]MDE6799492.1 radical SAM-associated putative lipoprotein [Phocaeicola sp.]GFH98270.1 hypothetical protein IMSAGC004_00659 [Bacteroidaceae bacterium]